MARKGQQLCTFVHMTTIPEAVMMQREGVSVRRLSLSQKATFALDRAPKFSGSSPVASRHTLLRILATDETNGRAKSLSAYDFDPHGCRAGATILGLVSADFREA